MHVYGGRILADGRRSYNSDHKSSKRLTGISEGDCRVPVPKGVGGFSVRTTWGHSPLIENFVGMEK